MDSINPNLKGVKLTEMPSSGDLLEKLRHDDRTALSRALTLVESTLPAHREIAEELIAKALPFSGSSIRIGITGVPGVGKSTFIESFGEYITSTGKKVAVLAIDPSSSKNRGSILGDKTRMNSLSQNENAFIRPSPAAGSLGGVARKTRESVLICEAAGYEIILIETVGVGQSETAVKSMVDFFMLLMLPGAGDELQGIKRGIMEMADLIVINKADGENLQTAKRAGSEYKRALHLFPPSENEWIPKVTLCSAIQQQGISEVWEIVEEFQNHQKTKGYFEATRRQQAINWFRDHLSAKLLESVYENPELKQIIARLEEEVKEHKAEPHTAVQAFFKNLWFGRK